MKLYKVIGGPVAFAAGTVLGLDGDQLARRVHLVEIKKAPAAGKTTAGARLSVALKDVCQFKVGEILGVADPIDKVTLDRLEYQLTDAERAAAAKKIADDKAAAEAAAKKAADEKAAAEAAAAKKAADDKAA